MFKNYETQTVKLFLLLEENTLFIHWILNVEVDGWDPILGKNKRGNVHTHVRLRCNSCNHCSSGRAITITHSDSVSVA